MKDRTRGRWLEMPAQQHGTVIRRAGRYQARWFDANGKRRSRNFATKSEAKQFLKHEVERVQKQRLGLVAPDVPATVDALLDVFLARWGQTVDPATLRKVTSQLRHARRAFGGRHPETLTVGDLEDWRHGLSEGARHDVFRAFRQVFAWALLRGLVERDPTRGIKNPTRPKHERRRMNLFQSWDEVEAVSRELDHRFAAIPVILADTGLRPEELFGLHRSDVDWERCEFTIRRRYTQCSLKDGLKRKGESERKVPFTQRTYDALKAMMPRVDTQILIPAARGGYINLAEFRYEHWLPALRAAGVGHHTLYDLRHTSISWALAAGIPPAKVALVHGTSLKQLDATYSHLVPSDVDAYRAALEAYAIKQELAQ